MMTSIALLLLMAVSGRAITREIDVFQVMEMRSIIAFLCCYRSSIAKAASKRCGPVSCQVT